MTSACTSKNMRRTPGRIILAALLLACGCCHTATGPHLRPYYGPTESMASVAQQVNANNEKIPTLWANLNYSAMVNENGTTHSVSGGDGILLYQPSDFRLVAKKEFVGTVFDLGTNGKEYWLEVVPGTNRMWWGRYDDLVHTQLGKSPIPIRPDLVLEVLGVSLINRDFNVPPVPTMRFNNDEDAYMFVFNVHAPDRWLALKEVWYDRASHRPRRVILYDANGRAVLRADLSMDTKVQVPGEDPRTWPVMAGDYKLFFPDTGSRMEFTVKDVRLYKQNPGGRLKVPNASSFAMPDVQGTDVRPIQIGGGGDH